MTLFYSMMSSLHHFSVNRPFDGKLVYEKYFDM